MNKRLLCLILIAALLLPWMGAAVPEVQAATKQEKTRAIGIVFDNSGSMYGVGNTSWCRATYAMEVFASMMNEGDQVQIYPMHPITLGVGTEADAIASPLVIRSPADAKTIRQIYSPNTGTTPMETVEEAYRGLMATAADEKYLIVINDGAFDGTGGSPEPIRALLDSYDQDMQVMFLGIGNIPVPSETDPSRQYYRCATDSADVLKELTGMCNRIFGRNTLENIAGNQFNVDVSMSKMIVFVQGKDVTDVQLSGGKKVSEFEMMYSTLGRGGGSGNSSFAVDDSLQGMLVTYEDLDAGSYNISYNCSGSAVVSVYYEPDVDLQIRLIDPDGNEVDPDGELYSGNYTIEYALVDKYGNPTSSALLGNVVYDITYTINDEKFNVSDTQPGSVSFDLPADGKFDGVFDVRYLSGYTIEKDGAALGWPFGGFQIGIRPAGSLELEVTGGADTYSLSELEQLAIYTVRLSRDGNAISGDDLLNAELTASIEGGNAKTQVERTADGFTVAIKYNGTAGDTQCGDQAVVFSGAYANQDGQVATASTKKEFEIQDDSTALKVKLERPQDFYEIGSLDSGEPITAKLTCGGEPLSPEQFASTDVAVTVEGLPTGAYTVEPDAENSCYRIFFQKTEGIEPGNYRVKCEVSGVDSVGRPAQVEASTDVELQNYPAWMRVAFWILVSLLVLALIWLFLNSKVLPKRIAIERCTFRVGSNEVTGEAECNFSGGGKKRGFLEINPPYFSGAPSASSCGVMLELVAVSPRRIPSSKRYIGIRGAVAGNEMHTTRMKFGGTTMVKNSEGTFVRMGTANDVTIEDDVDSGFPIAVYADVPGPRGRKVNVALDVRMQFY